MWPGCRGGVQGNVYSDLGYDSSDPRSNKFPLEGATVEIGGVTSDPLTDSTGWYRIVGLAAGADSIKASRSGFASCSEEVTIPCNDQVYWNPELRCQDIDWTILVTQKNRANPVYGADVTATFDIDGVCIDDLDINDTTDFAGLAVFTNALQTTSADGVTVVVTKDGYDTKTVTETAGIFLLSDFYQCGTGVAAPNDTIELCAYFTVYGVVETANHNPAIGYTVKAETTGKGTVLGSGTTGSNGNYALGGSIAACRDTDEGDAFYLRAYAPGGVKVYQSDPFDCVATDVDANDVQCGELRLENIGF